MFAFTRSPARRKGTGTALALALMCGSALGMVALEAPAAAQKNKKDQKDQKAGKANYSKAFVAAYTPVNEQANGGDAAGAKAKIPAVVAAIETDDDRNAAGGLIYNVGVGAQDQALQLQGIEMMIASGKTDPAKLGQYRYTAYQLNAAQGQYDVARKHLNELITMGYTFQGKMSDGSERTMGPDDMQMMIAETYFDQEDYAGGLGYIAQQVEQRGAAGGTVPQNWLTRPLSIAYQNNQTDGAIQFSKLFVKHYPSDTSWGDAIAIQRNLVDYDPQQTLDILRLAAKTNALRDTRSYVDYIDAADARRLPGEVKRLIDAGVAAGKLTESDVYVAEATKTAEGRVAADKADLPALERDAKAANATAVTASAAGDAFLSYEDYARAEAMYTIAASKPGADMDRVTLRLAIAQIGLGKTSEALANLAKVNGARKNIADLWAIYAQQNAATGG